MLHSIARFLVVVMGLFALSASGEDMFCPHINQGYGPYDYTNPDDRANKLPIVERYHFTPNIETLQSGNSGTVGGELDYTIRAFPNHHRALSALARLALKEKTNKPNGTGASVECYLDRATKFQPKDGMVRLIFANYLLKKNNLPLALEQFEAAEALLPNNINVEYNFGLYYFERKNYDKAYEYAKKAYDRGFPLPGLKNKLAKVGKWKN